MYCPEHLAYKGLGDRVYIWLYWRDGFRSNSGRYERNRSRSYARQRGKISYRPVQIAG